MFQPKGPSGMQQPVAAPAQQPQQAAQPNTTPQGGPRQVANIGFNQDVQNILLSRIQTLTPQEEKLMDSALTPQNIPVFLKIFPELKPLFDMMMGGGQGGQQGPIGQQGQPPAGATPPQAAGGAPSAAQPGGQPGQEPDGDEEDESDNPLVRAPASSGLIG